MTKILDSGSIAKKLKLLSITAASRHPYKIIGYITRVNGMRLEAKGLSVPTGTICKIETSPNDFAYAEVIGFSNNIVYLMPMDEIYGVKFGTKVIPLTFSNHVPVGMHLLGRVIDAKGNPIDKQGMIDHDDYYSIVGKTINPLDRSRITEPLDVGIRAINGIMSIGKGQRIGIFAGSGVGKSVLLGMMTRFTKADVIIVGLVGERGREVKEFIEESIGVEGMKRATVIASPADTSPLMRANSALLATTIAEYFRDKGLDVLLIIDSITRYAHALREISMSAGEMPATRGFTPSVFAKLSQLVERTGIGINGVGSITAFYTVLVDGDENNDPVADHVRSVLDGHIILSRQIADSGTYPAIDVEKSISRIMPQVTTDEHLKSANRFKQLYGAYTHNKELINMGMYQVGSDKLIDDAMAKKESIFEYLNQEMNESSNFQDSYAGLKNITGAK